MVFNKSSFSFPPKRRQKLIKGWQLAPLINLLHDRQNGVKFGCCTNKILVFKIKMNVCWQESCACEMELKFIWKSLLSIRRKIIIITWPKNLPTYIDKNNVCNCFTVYLPCFFSFFFFEILSWIYGNFLVHLNPVFLLEERKIHVFKKGHSVYYVLQYIRLFTLVHYVYAEQHGF